MSNIVFRNTLRIIITYKMVPKYTTIGSIIVVLISIPMEFLMTRFTRNKYIHMPNIVIKPDLVTLLYGDRPPVYSLALRLRNTKVPVWTHESIGYPKMDISQFCFSSIWNERKQMLLHVLWYKITLSIAVILSENTLTTSVMVKTSNDICVSFTSTNNIGLLVVVYAILLSW